MNKTSWAKDTVEILKKLGEDNNVISLSIFGSYTDADIKTDIWSDIDVLIVVEDEAEDRFYPETIWLKELGDIFAVEQVAENSRYVTKVIFNDLRKIDFIITTSKYLLENDNFALTNQQIIFSKSDAVTKRLSQISQDNMTFDINNYNLEKISNEFWYLAYMAVAKIARKDLLIALHLTLELYKKCLVLSMWLRDREKGTSIHRVGAPSNVNTKQITFPNNMSTDTDILEMITRAGQCFDKLATKWSNGSKSKFALFAKELAKRNVFLN